jgi:hypothetical protein
MAVQEHRHYLPSAFPIPCVRRCPGRTVRPSCWAICPRVPAPAPTGPGQPSQDAHVLRPVLRTTSQTNRERILTQSRARRRRLKPKRGLGGSAVTFTHGRVLVLFD